ncbi:endonuclease/exonuclease/phosphatase family protein [Psychromarinibacter sp. C21-152]|uniref:Endonuclease/exonuclease/phosphatase family protein n=1 Tax=Psychromarinibacter sediminicola TaxID=3033385 RepID=A0AAE3T8K8_9RHOB|nr:endonuclease/exonuclease/phosphatase family protein [Psychromarinibacter sediminicola]MDF0600159.1 endonuclease/exonuclease/phosphatase family protein [Psychromarinibacter sediminicola]
MRIATYNIEWFNALFDDRNGLLEDSGLSGREGVSRADQLAALGIVFTAMDADAVLVVEAPDTVRGRSTTAALEAFADRYALRTRRALLGFANQTQQEIALLYDPDALDARHDPIGDPTGGHAIAEAPRFDGTFRLDLDTDAAPESVTFSKPPLEAALTTRGGLSLRLIGVHVKSKAPHGADTPDEILRLSIQNRRKQLAQCVWLRRRVESHLDAGEELIVLGDFNDGPGLDEYEKLFGRSGVEIVLGDPGKRGLYDPHARMALSQRVGAMPVTARFYIHPEGRYLQALLDYIMVSPGLRRRNPRWRIWHPFDDPACYRTPELRDALLTASDHFPVSLDFDDGP